MLLAHAFSRALLARTPRPCPSLTPLSLARCIQALAYQTKAIVDALGYDDPPISCVVACGGLSKNPLYVATHADVLGVPIHLPVQEEAVLLGAAILGAAAGGEHASVEAAMARMSAIGATVAPDASTRVYHQRKHAVFSRMSDDQCAYRRIMEGSAG